MADEILYKSKKTLLQDMSFSGSSHSIKHVSGGVLGATCKTATGADNNSAFDLDGVLGNNNGHFQWGGKDWSKSARNITISGSTLKAELQKMDGCWEWSTVNLDAHITNNNGHLQYQA